jgi:hypothetical protein
MGMGFGWGMGEQTCEGTGSGPTLYRKRVLVDLAVLVDSMGR